MIEFEIGVDDLERMQKALGATDKLARTSLLRAAKRTQKWLGTRVKETLSKELGVPPKAIGVRIKLGNPTEKRVKGRVWVGLEALEAARIGRASGARPGSNKKKKTKGRGSGTGVKVGKHHFPHAFILESEGSGRRVVERTTTKRFPLRNVMIPIYDESVAALTRKPWPDAQRFLLDEFERLMLVGLKRVTK